MLIVVSATSSSGSANEHSAVRGNNNNSVSEVTRDSVDVKQFFKEEKLSPSEREFFGLDSSQVCGMVIALAQRLYSSLSDFVDLIC